MNFGVKQIAVLSPYTLETFTTIFYIMITEERRRKKKPTTTKSKVQTITSQIVLISLKELLHNIDPLAYTTCAQQFQ